MALFDMMTHEIVRPDDEGPIQIEQRRQRWYGPRARPRIDRITAGCVRTRASRPFAREVKKLTKLRERTTEIASSGRSPSAT